MYVLRVRHIDGLCSDCGGNDVFSYQEVGRRGRIRQFE
jgi:hypothetical protein